MFVAGSHVEPIIYLFRYNFQPITVSFADAIDYFKRLEIVGYFFLYIPTRMTISKPTRKDKK